MPHPFTRLSARKAGIAAEEVFRDGVPEWLDRPLREWMNEAFDGNEYYARHVALRLQRTQGSNNSWQSTVLNVKSSDLLDAVDLTLQMHAGWSDPPHRRSTLQTLVVMLERILSDGSSLYSVDIESHQLIERVDETVRAAVSQAIDTAKGSAGDHLKKAWISAYGREKSPDTVVSEAIRAVEEVACPLVEQKKADANLATLGTVIGDLTKNSYAKWELVLPDSAGSPSNIDLLIGMLRALWESQVSRHGGAPKSRRTTQEEAIAALHLAVLLVQWLSAGVLKRK